MNTDDVLKLLNKIEFPVNKTRANVKRTSRTKVLGMAVGVVQVRFRDYARLSKYTRDHPHIVKALVDFAKQTIPNFRFTTIQINKNNQTALHVDRNNLGPSAMIGLGNYEGGEIWIADEGIKSFKNKFCFFDGNEPHGTMPFTGTRYTLVYFTQQRYKHLLDVDKPLLKCIDFPTPSFGRDAPVRKKYSSRKHRLQEVESEFVDVLQKYQIKMHKNKKKKAMAKKSRK